MDGDLKEVVAARGAGAQPQPIDDLVEWRRRHLERHGPWAPPTPRYAHASDYIKLMDVGALIELETWRRICDFANTSTLDDRIEPARARSLYRLGRQVTLIGHQYLAAAMHSRGEIRPVASTE